MSVLKKNISLILLVTALLFSKANAQSLKFETSLDTNTITIGDTVSLFIKITQPFEYKLSLPDYKDTIVTGVEVLEKLKLDTLNQNATSYTLLQRYIVSSYDSGAYNISVGPLKIEKNGLIDTMWSEKILLNVNTIPIDTAKGIADVKLPYDTPLTFKEILPWLLWGLLALILIGGGLYFYFKYSEKNRQKHFVHIPKELPHIIAYRELDKLKEEKLWQKEKYKLFYSRLTEIIRIYIENRYTFPAMEQTSDEILSIFDKSQYIDGESFEKLKQILYTADVAKFAKAEPLPEENEMSFTNAYDFISRTKIKSQKEKEKEEEQQIQDNKNV